MELLTEKSRRLLEEMAEKSLQELAETGHPRYDSPALENMRREVAGYRLTRPSTKQWYNPQRFLRHFR